MTKASTTNMAKAIFAATKDKSGSELDSVLANSIKIIASKGMLDKSESILKSLGKILDKEAKILRAKVYSVNELSHKNIEEIKHELSHRYKAEIVHLENIIDKEILGGIKIEVHDEVIDLTARKQINQLKKHLLN